MSCFVSIQPVCIFWLEHLIHLYLKQWKGKFYNQDYCTWQGSHSNWWRNQKLFRQPKVKRIQYYQTSFTTNVKGTYMVKKYEKEKDVQNQPQTIKKMAIGTYTSIITLHVNRLNAPTKRHWLAEWIQKQDPYIRCLQETHFRPKDTYRLRVRGWKNMFHVKESSKRKL